MISAFDRRQLIKMQEQIISFKEGSLPLGALIGDLTFLLDSTESMPVAWKTFMHEQIVTLEEVYAVILDRGLDVPDDVGGALIKEGIQNLQEQLQMVL